MVSLFNVRDNNFINRQVKRWRNFKCLEKEDKRSDFVSNNEEWPIWTKLFKFNNLSKIKHLSSSSSQNPSNIKKTKPSKIARISDVFTSLREGNGKKVKIKDIRNYKIEVKDETRMRQRLNRKR